MRIEELLEDLFQDVPEIKRSVFMMLKAYHVSISDGRYPVWQYGVMECVEFLLEEANTYQHTLKKIFQFFEKMASAEEDTREFFMCSVMDYFCERPNLIPTAKRFMGPFVAEAWTEYRRFDLDAQLFRLSQLYSDEELDAMKQV